MVAKVTSGKNIRGILNYNENKVRQGLAKCIMASRFGCEPEKLSFSDKVNGFRKLTILNPRTKTNAIHISLNFHASENLSVEKLKEITTAYMDRIGFGDQPYLVYQHFDAAHPHIHIATSNIKSNGKRIDIHNIGRNQSEKARKEIENIFGLVQAEGRKNQNELPIHKIDKAVYGKLETKRSITNIVRYVTRFYKYTSLPELNVVLSQFNVLADRGKEGSTIFKKKGLQYCITDDHGKKVGIPVKASSIYGKPTLDQLEKQFRLNEVLRVPYKERLKVGVDHAFKDKKVMTRSAFVKALQEEHIHVLFRQNDEGRIYGITFVDNKTKVVFNGSDLGKAYSAKSIVDRLTKLDPHAREAGLPDRASAKAGEWFDASRENESQTQLDPGLESLVVDLTNAEAFDYSSPDAATRKRRRKKRKKKGRSL
ncbi:MAG TPA: relaxase/mobilization nuclease domain-containing protein [Cyclobacteriaceae bacterium]|nr:relaxase/mobilization nuclease domain-containing protein [Cyclobacteriaceae bacterium]